MAEEPIPQGRLFVPIWLKTNLTIKEAAAISGIGEQTIREETMKPHADFAFKVGNKTMINRALFDKYIEEELCGAKSHK